MNKKTVTVGISAYNAQDRIGGVLKSILSQKQDAFVIHSIQIAVDGCTDKTAEVIDTFSSKSSIITVINDGKRLGKSERLNNFYKNLKSDILIVIDDDITFKNNSVFSEIVKAFENPDVGLVGGNVYPDSQTSFVGKSLEAYEKFWLRMVQSLNGGNCVHSHAGPLSAGSREFLKTVQIPRNIVAEDHFLFFKAVESGFKYRFAKNAVVYFKVPSTLKDFLIQTTRFHASVGNIRKYFGSWVEEYYSIPFSVKMKSYFRTFFENPVYLVSALLLQLYQRIIAPKIAKTSNTQLWTRISTNK